MDPLDPPRSPVSVRPPAQEVDEAMDVDEGSLGDPLDAERDDVLSLSPGCSGFGSDMGNLSGDSSLEDEPSDHEESEEDCSTLDEQSHSAETWGLPLSPCLPCPLRS